MWVDVVYDSKTGNTEKIANSIARAFSTKAVRVSDVDNFDYEFLLIGSPTNAMRPTPAIIEFIEKVSAKYVAVFSTYWMRDCNSWMEKKLAERGFNVIGRFSCPGEFRILNKFVVNKGKPGIKEYKDVKHFVNLMKNKLKNPRLLTK